MICMIWCQDLNGGISKNNKLPWNNREEMQHFITTTTNKIVVMGRKTYESIGHPLKNRINIILSHQKDLEIPGCFVYQNIQDILKDYQNKDLYIIGGVSVYEAFFKHANILIISYLNESYDCDRFLNFDLRSFKLIETITKTTFVIKKYERFV